MDKAKLEHSKQFIKEYLSDDGIKKTMLFSGGKDSVVVKHLLEICKVKNVDFYYNNSGIESDDLKEYLIQNYPDVIWINPDLDISEEWKKRKYLPYPICLNNDFIKATGMSSLKTYYCCYNIRYSAKNEIVNNYSIVINGCKKSDPSNSLTYKNEIMHFNNQTFYMPIYDWTNEDVVEYINQNNLKLNNDYGSTGKTFTCPICPIATPSSSITVKELFPDLYEKCKNIAYYCFENNPFLQKQFETKEEYWDCCQDKNLYRQKVYIDSKYFIDPETGITYSNETGSVVL